MRAAPWLSPLSFLRPSTPLYFGGGDTTIEAADNDDDDEDYEKLKDSYEKDLDELSGKLDGMTTPILESPAPTLPTSPASTTNTAEIAQAEEDARKQAAKRRGLLETIVAGETGTSNSNTLLTTSLGNQGTLGAT